MTETNRSMQDVYALLDERRRYEAWLAALDDRRESTPAHVFERVEADYRRRLEQVAERFAGYRPMIDDERASVASRQSLLEADVQMRRDERAELELRAHVGELGEADAGRAFAAVDEATERLARENDELHQRMNELDALLADQPSVTPAPDAEPREFDEMAFLDGVVGDDGSASPAAAEATPESDSQSQSPPDRTDNASSGYEHIVTPDEADADRLLAGLEEGSARSGSEHAPPLAANVTANNPIVLRTVGGVEQTKTLKCSECGAMNYPTEWYCERCGAELAAL